jgi:thiamine-phosphate pyrophosphorylase
MSKIILISPEHNVSNEILLVQEMLRLDDSLRFHLRKMNWSKTDYFEYLQEINPLFYSRISIHEFHDLQLNFPAIGLHYKEVDREDYVTGKTHDSTSFHSKKNALELGKEFDYFFCSPVFQSISKKNYHSDENWDINTWEESLRKKAVALGGIDASKIKKAKQLGFEKFAIFGTIWMSENPIQTFKEILNICQK